MVCSQSLIGLVEHNLTLLADTFVTNVNNYFFTEKELHAHFYYLAMKSGAFQHRGHHLLHAEYPSPFKCSHVDGEPYMKCQPGNSKAQRGRIDCVVINPRFVDWHLDNRRDIKELIGIENNRFDIYVKDLYDAYVQFRREVGEAILLYAVEFKFLRRSYEGCKYPVKAIHQDIAKLRLLRQFGEDLLNRVHFVERTKVAIFIGEDMQKAGAVIGREMARYDPSECYIVTRE